MSGASSVSHSGSRTFLAAARRGSPPQDHLQAAPRRCPRHARGTDAALTLLRARREIRGLAGHPADAGWRFDAQGAYAASFALILARVRRGVAPVGGE